MYCFDLSVCLYVCLRVCVCVRPIAGREMPQIHGNWALGDKFLQFCMMLHMGIRYSKTTANKVG